MSSLLRGARPCHMITVIASRHKALHPVLYCALCRDTCLVWVYSSCICAAHAPVWYMHQVLGAKRKTLAGYSSSTVQPHQGFIYGCALIQGTPQGEGLVDRLVEGNITSGKCVCVCVFGGSPLTCFGSITKNGDDKECMLGDLSPDCDLLVIRVMMMMRVCCWRGLSSLSSASIA